MLWILLCHHCLLTSEFSFRQVNSTSQSFHLLKENLSIPPTGLSSAEVSIRRALDSVHSTTAENTLSLEKHASSLPGHCYRVPAPAPRSQLQPQLGRAVDVSGWQPAMSAQVSLAFLSPSLCSVHMQNCQPLQKTQPLTPRQCDRTQISQTPRIWRFCP